MNFEELITRMKNNNDILEEVKAKCLKMVAHVKNLEQEKCELLGIIQKKDELIEKMKCCSNCKHFNKENDLEYCWNCERQLVNSLDNLSREEIIKDEWEIKV